MVSMLKAPYPYFGGKSRAAAEIWKRIGDVPLYVEPFLGSGAVWLARPHPDPTRHMEHLNDKHGFIPNFWRAIRAEPDAVAKVADYPVFECDLHARHSWLVERAATTDLVARLEGDPEFYDVKIAGWWVWGMAMWLGSGFCSGRGPWQSVDGRLVRDAGDGQGIQRQRLHHGNYGQGIKRQLLHHGDTGRGANRRDGNNLADYFASLSARVHRGVRVSCGDYTRVLDRPTVNWGLNDNDATLTGVLLDPPYNHAERDKKIYAQDDDIDHAVRAWCLANGDNPNQRIAYCTYEDGDTRLREAGWSVYRWTAHGGYGNNGNGRGRANKTREVIWFSPHCVAQERQQSLFDKRGEGNDDADR